MNITAPAFSRTSNCHWCWAASSGVFGRCLPPAGLCFVVVKIESTQHEYIHAAPLAYCCLLLAASDACLLLLAASDSCLAACLLAAWRGLAQPCPGVLSQLWPLRVYLLFVLCQLLPLRVSLLLIITTCLAADFLSPAASWGRKALPSRGP